jgi:hypothetical protein
VAATGSVKQNLWLVADTSGSMAEGGKRFLVRGLARAVEQYVRLGYASAEPKLVLWGATATLANWTPDGEFPPELLQNKGSADATPLLRLLNKETNGKVLFLTDGFWSRDTARTLKKWKASLPPDTVRILLTGADANPQLKSNDVFFAEDFFTALDGWLEAPKEEEVDSWE